MFDAIKTALPKNNVELVRSFSISNLRRDLGKLSLNTSRLRAVIVVGHSNEVGLQIAGDSFLEWKSVAQFFQPFEPKQIFALACSAGKWEPCSAMFESLQSLQEIFASPMPADKSQAIIVAGKAIHALAAPREDTRLNSFMQLLNFGLTGNVFVHRTRREFENANDSDIQIWSQVLEPGLDLLAKAFRRRNV